MKEFEAICRDYSPVVYRFLLGLCGDANLAEELTAETFYRAKDRLIKEMEDELRR